MQRPPHAARECPKQDIAGVLHKLENLTRVSFCHLCYTLGNTCGSTGVTHQAPHSYRSTALWTPPKPSYALMASSTTTTASPSMRGVSSTTGPPPDFPTLEAPTPMDVSPGYNPLVHARVGRGTSASVQAELGWAMDTWHHRLAPATTLSPPSTSCCLRKSRDTSHHPVPAGSTPTSAGEVCSSPHQGGSYNEPESECGLEGKTTNQGARRSPGTGLSF